MSRLASDSPQSPESTTSEGCVFGRVPEARCGLEFWATCLLASILGLFAAWSLTYLVVGPRLALNHDELNFIDDSLRLLAQGRLQNYGHGPLLYEVIAVVETFWFIALRLTGMVHSSGEFLGYVFTHLGLQLAVCRALVCLAAVGCIYQVYRLGRLFGGRWTGALAALLCATNLTFIAFSSLCKEDPLYWMLLLLACTLAWQVPEDRTIRSAVLCGVAIGASIAAKLLGIFGLGLLAVPLFRLPRDQWKKALGRSGVIAAAAGMTLLVLEPFLVTDTANVIGTIRTMGGNASAWPGLDQPTLGVYLRVHLPNLVGWWVIVAGLVECAWRLVREPRGPILLFIVPALLAVFLGVRPGFSMAYYLFPLALFLCVLAAALAVRLMQAPWLGRWRLVPLVMVGLVAALDPAFLRGSAKHALLITGKDTRLLARDDLTARASAGESILLLAGIAGLNFYGPPLLAADPPEGTGPYAAAQRRVLERTSGKRFRLHVVGGSDVMGISPDVVAKADWIVAPTFGWPTAEFGPKGRATDPPGEFRVDGVIHSTAEDLSSFFPFYTSRDYDELRRLSLARLLGARTMPWTQVIYRRERPAPDARSTAM
jgi:hypothetical protein